MLTADRTAARHLAPEGPAPGMLAAASAMTVRGLRPAASRVSLAGLLKLAACAAADPSAWRALVRFDDQRRWYHRLALTDDYEIWLLSWTPGQRTGFHDHGEASGAFAVALGTLTERVVTAGPSWVRARQAMAGTRRAFGPRHIHDVCNDYPRPAISVHAYSPPLTAMRRFELTEAGLVHVGTDGAARDW